MRNSPGQKFCPGLFCWKQAVICFFLVPDKKETGMGEALEPRSRSVPMTGRREILHRFAVQNDKSARLVLGVGRELASAASGRFVNRPYEGFGSCCAVGAVINRPPCTDD